MSTSETDTDQSHDGTAEHVVQLLCEYIEEVEERIGERLATLPSCEGALRTDVSQTVVRCVKSRYPCSTVAPPPVFHPGEG